MFKRKTENERMLEFIIGFMKRISDMKRYGSFKGDPTFIIDNYMTGSKILKTKLKKVPFKKDYILKITYLPVQSLNKQVMRIGFNDFISAKYYLEVSYINRQIKFVPTCYDFLEVTIRYPKMSKVDFEDLFKNYNVHSKHPIMYKEV